MVPLPRVCVESGDVFLFFHPAFFFFAGHCFLRCSFPSVTQIWGHRAGTFPATVLAFICIARRVQHFERRRLARIKRCACTCYGYEQTGTLCIGFSTRYNSRGGRTRGGNLLLLLFLRVLGLTSGNVQAWQWVILSFNVDHLENKQTNIHCPKS